MGRAAGHRQIQPHGSDHSRREAQDHEEVHECRQESRNHVVRQLRADGQLLEILHRSNRAAQKQQGVRQEGRFGEPLPHVGGARPRASSEVRQHLAVVGRILPGVRSHRRGRRIRQRSRFARPRSTHVGVDGLPPFGHAEERCLRRRRGQIGHLFERRWSRIFCGVQRGVGPRNDGYFVGNVGQKRACGPASILLDQSECRARFVREFCRQSVQFVGIYRRCPVRGLGDQPHDGLCRGRFVGPSHEANLGYPHGRCQSAQGHGRQKGIGLPPVVRCGTRNDAGEKMGARRQLHHAHDLRQGGQLPAQRRRYV